VTRVKERFIVMKKKLIDFSYLRYKWAQDRFKGLKDGLKTEFDSWLHRLMYGWHKVEAYNLCYYIADYAYPRIRHLKKHTHGYPPDFIIKAAEDMGIQYHPSKETPEMSERAFGLWKLALEEMEWMFQQYKNDTLAYLTDDGRDRLENAQELFGKYFGHLWD
jgi:hypothetical protein